MILDIINKYDAVFLDAYGVLVDGSGPIAGSAEFIRQLKQSQKAYLMVTNDASRQHSSISKRLASFGIDISENKIISSGSLLKPYFEKQEMIGAKTCVLGTTESHEFAVTAGGVLVDPISEPEFDLLILADEAGYPFIETVDAVVSHLIQMFDKGTIPRLVLPNPDLLYPKAPQACGLAAGSIALMIEAALSLRYGDGPQYKFDRLGKPHSMIFEMACAQLETQNVLMIGDQLHTDVLGAQNFGIDSLLVLTGLTKQAPEENSQFKPSYVFDNLEVRPA